MSFYEDLVMQTQQNYARHCSVYAAGGRPYEPADPALLPYPAQIARLVWEIWEADCILVGEASGLSAAGGGVLLSRGQRLLPEVLWQVRGEVRISESL